MSKTGATDSNHRLKRPRNRDKIRKNINYNNSNIALKLKKLEGENMIESRRDNKEREESC